MRIASYVPEFDYDEDVFFLNTVLLHSENLFLGPFCFYFMRIFSDLYD